LRYSIDTSAILDGWRRYYPPDVLPDVWTGFDNLIKKGHLAATEEVVVELEKRDDEVHKWAKKRKGMFVPIDHAIQKAVSSILGAHEKLVDTRKNRSAADPFVIALAQIQGCAVVTGERATGSATGRTSPTSVRAWVSGPSAFSIFPRGGLRFVRAR
jgi:hypothetical protein